MTEFSDMNRDSQIDQILTGVKVIWREHPYLRFGQLMTHVASRLGWRDSFYLGDREVYEELQRWDDELHGIEPTQEVVEVPELRGGNVGSD